MGKLNHEFVLLPYCCSLDGIYPSELWLEFPTTTMLSTTIVLKQANDVSLYI